MSRNRSRKGDGPPRLLSDVLSEKRLQVQGGASASPVTKPRDSSPVAPPKEETPVITKKPPETKRKLKAREVMARALAVRNAELDQLYP